MARLWEIIGVPTAISVVSKRMAKKLALPGRHPAEKEGGKPDAFSQYKFLNLAIFAQSFYVFRNRYFDIFG